MWMCVCKPVLRCVFQLRDTPVRVRVLLAVAPADARLALVHAAVLHAALLHQLQHQLPPLLYVRHHVPQMSLAAHPQEAQESLAVPLQPPAVHLGEFPSACLWQQVLA